MTAASWTFSIKTLDILPTKLFELLHWHDYEIHYRKQIGYNMSMGTKINSWFTTMHSTFYKTKTLYERHLKRFQASASRGGGYYTDACA